MLLQVHNEEEIQKILPIAAKHGVPVTFRAAGTSLSGQAITDSVLLKLSHTGRNFRNYTIHVRCPALRYRTGFVADGSFVQLACKCMTPLVQTSARSCLPFFADILVDSQLH